MTQGVHNQKQWRESRRKHANPLCFRIRTGPGCAGSGDSLVSQNLGMSLPVSTRIKEVMICLAQVI